MQNGYSPEEVTGYISRGARWFGIARTGELISACLVFPNYERIWEIGGVFTHPAFLGQGYAKSVVLAALEYLLLNGHRPRYQFREDNIATSAGRECQAIPRHTS